MVEAEKLRAQAALIGGTILLIILVAVILPLILQLNQTAVNIEQGVRLAAQVKMRATKEKVYVSFFYNETTAAILVNNTGTIRVVIERIIIINRTSGGPIASPGICGAEVPCGLINVANASQNPLVSNAPPLYDDCRVGILRGGTNLYCLDNKNQVAVLDPGDVLYISIDPDIVLLLNNSYVYAESAYGVIHPVITPPSVGKGGAPISPKLLQAIPRGLYTTFTGFMLWGYEEIHNNTYTEVLHPPYRVTTIGPCTRWEKQSRYIGGIPYDWYSFAWDYTRPGTFKITFKLPDELDMNYYLFIYTRRGWYRLKLEPGATYTIVGFIGVFSEGIARYNNEHVIVLDGWCHKIYKVEDGYLKNVLRVKPAILDYPKEEPELVKEGIIYESDSDGNGISEFGIRTIKSTDYAWDVIDADGSKNIMCWAASQSVLNSDDIVAYKITILRDITGVDAVQISLKAIMDYWFYIGTNYYRPSLQAIESKPVIAVALLKLDDDYKWRIINIKALELSLMAPYEYWVNVLFPINRTSIYRLVIIVYDPIGLINIGGDKYIYGWEYGALNTLDLYVNIEHIIIQYFVYNPILRKVPAVYIVNMTGVPYWPSGVATSYGTFGYLNETMLSEYWNALLDYLAMYSVHPVNISDWGAFKALLGSPQAPIGAIVIFLHGPILPYESGLKLYDALSNQWITVYTPYDFVKWLADMVKARKWIVVFPYGPPLAFVWNTATGTWESGPNAYIAGSLLSNFVQHLLDLSTTPDVSYIFVYTGGFEPVENYTVGRLDSGWEAVKAARAWAAPRIFIGNYSIVSRTPIVYDYMTPFWANYTPPLGYTWSMLGVPQNGYAGGVVALNATTGGVVVFVAAPRPGAVSPRGLAALDIAAMIYEWKQLFKG